MISIYVFLFVGAIRTPRQWESPGIPCATARNSFDPSFPACHSPDLIYGIFNFGRRRGWREPYQHSQPPSATHGTLGAGPQSNRSVCSLWHLPSLLLSCQLLCHIYCTAHLFIQYSFCVTCQTEGYAGQLIYEPVLLLARFKIQKIVLNYFLYFP